MNDSQFNMVLPTNDVIQGAAYPSYQGTRQKGLLLIGNNHTYLVSIGADYLETLTQLDTKKVAISRPITLYRYADNSFKIELYLDFIEDSFNSVNPTKTRVTEELLAAIPRCQTIQPQLQFKQLATSAKTNYFQPVGVSPNSVDNTYFSSHRSCYLTLEGALYAPKPIADIELVSDLNLFNGQIIYLKYIGKKELKHKMQSGTLPLSQLKQAITLPLQLLGIGKIIGNL